MALRIRSKWRPSQQQVSLEDNSTALAYIIWQLALAAAKNLHVEDFEYDDDKQRVAVITEYLCFLVHVADRLAYYQLQLDDEQRQRYIVTLAQQTARHLQRNTEDIMGPDDYHTPYINLFNERSADYATTTFSDNPGYDMLRYLGLKIQAVMGNSQTNRWVIDQVMEIDALNAVDELRKAYNNLFTTMAATQIS